MNGESVKNWCKTLTSSRDWPHDNEAIEKLWKPIKEDLTPKEQVSLLNCLVQKDNIFKWLYLVSHLIPELFSEDQNFITLIEIIIDKVKNDMAQGVFIRSLIDIGEKDPREGINLYHRLIEVSSDLTISYSGLILGGAAKRRFDDVFAIIERDLRKDKISIKIACLKALRVAFETEGVVEFPPRILDILEEMWKNKDPSVRTEVIQGYVDFRRYNPQVCEQKLLEIARTGSSLERLTITNRLWFQDLQDQSIEVEILKICSEDNNVNVFESVAHVLSRKGQAYLNDSLEIVRKMLKKYSLYDIPDLEYSVQKLCEKNREACQETFQKWHDSDKDLVFRFHLKSLKERLDRF